MAEGASVAHQARRLHRATRLHRPQRERHRRRAVRAHGDPRQQTGRHLCRLRTALSAFHRTGLQGRPEHGVFIQITADDAKDLPVPDQKASFGIIKAAQARGDFGVLTERGRRALRLHIKGRRRQGSGDNQHRDRQGANLRTHDADRTRRPWPHGRQYRSPPDRKRASTTSLSTTPISRSSPILPITARGQPRRWTTSSAS